MQYFQVHPYNVRADMYSHIKLQIFMNENDRKRIHVPSKTDVILSQKLPEAVTENVKLKKFPGEHAPRPL